MRQAIADGSLAKDDPDAYRCEYRAAKSMVRIPEICATRPVNELLDFGFIID